MERTSKNTDFWVSTKYNIQHNTVSEKYFEVVYISTDLKTYLNGFPTCVSVKCISNGFRLKPFIYYYSLKQTTFCKLVLYIK